MVRWMCMLSNEGGTDALYEFCKIRLGEGGESSFGKKSLGKSADSKHLGQRRTGDLRDMREERVSLKLTQAVQTFVHADVWNLLRTSSWTRDIVIRSRS